MAHDQLKKGSTELLILSLARTSAAPRLRDWQTHRNAVERAPDLPNRIAYPVLCRLEARGLISGRWAEKAVERRRRFYRLTAEGRAVLKRQQSAWKSSPTPSIRFSGAVMRNWHAYVRERLHLSTARPTSEMDVIDDLAGQLEDAYREAIDWGLSESEADAAASAHVTDWAALGAPGHGVQTHRLDTARPPRRARRRRRGRGRRPRTAPRRSDRRCGVCGTTRPARARLYRRRDSHACARHWREHDHLQLG